MSKEWHKQPEQQDGKATKTGFFRYLWAAICAGTGSGLIIGVVIVVFDAIGRVFGKPLTSPALDFKLELSAIALVVFASGGFGLIFASPIAFLFGGAVVRASANLKRAKQNFVRYGFGIIAAIAIFYLIGLINNANSPLFFEPAHYLMALIAGVSAVFIFLSQIRLPQIKDKQP